eukprot:g16663.t1
MGFFGMVLKPGQKEAVEVPPGWCLQLCTAALEPSKKGVKPRDVRATLWVQVEGNMGDASYLLGSLWGGGPCAQIPVSHCLTSVDGEVIIEAKGGGIVHLTGFFNREYDPDLEQEDESSEEGEEESEEESGEGSQEGSNLSDDEEEGGEAEGSNCGPPKGQEKRAGRRVRSAAAAAALACGTGDGEDSEDDSEVDGEYLPEYDDMEDDDDEDEDEQEEEEEEEDNDNDETVENGKGDGNDKKRPPPNAEGTAAASPSSSNQQRPPKKPKQAAVAAAEEEAEDAGATASPAGGEGGEEGNGNADTSEMTKQERKRQRRKENKRKAMEAKKGLEEAFRAMESDDAGELPIGVPLKNPRTKTLKGGLKIKDTTLGGGKIAVPGKNVKICYEGCFPDGRVFDKNNNRRRPLQFRVGMKKVIVGMDRGVEGMRVGGSREIAIPAALGYGARGTGPIPANQDLVFRVELVDVLGK